MRDRRPKMDDNKTESKHMKQKQIFTINGALNAGKLIVAGIAEVGAGVMLPFNPAADINTDLVNQIMACGNHEQAKQIKVARRKTLVLQIDECTTFIRATRDMFKIIWGTEFSELFTALGFKNGSIAMPDSLEDLIGMLQAIKTHLTTNPTQEVGTVITAARAQALLDSLFAAQQAVVSQEAEIESTITIRDEKFEALKKRISNVYQELRMQLAPLDPRWMKFGMNMPGADETPDQVTGLKVTLIGPTAAATKWEASVRAAYYRVYIRVIGVDADYRAIGSPADLDFTIENLPAGATIDVVVTAVNNGGEGARSEVVRIVTH
ncbi:MAG: hypothetical protein JWM68_3328 [Verrucomicrobiales bacterium]|nr:hypothetical protein [Verrucomicrobiales bacterium]